MRATHPFTAQDLQELDERLLSRADRVVSMRQVHLAGGFSVDSPRAKRIIGLRHDVDDNPGSLETAERLAEWEADRGYRSTFFLLHGSYYWRNVIEPALRIQDLGHEIGIHSNAIAEALRGEGFPEEILANAVAELRREGLEVVGTVAHGDPLCRARSGTVRFVNDELFVECARPDLGDPSRTVSHAGRSVKIIPTSLARFGLDYDANWLPRGDYFSDSGGAWSRSFDEVADGFGGAHLHVLIHPDWWSKAFTREEVAR